MKIATLALFSTASSRRSASSWRKAEPGCATSFCSEKLGKAINLLLYPRSAPHTSDKLSNCKENVGTTRYGKPCSERAAYLTLALRLGVIPPARGCRVVRYQLSLRLLSEYWSAWLNGFLWVEPGMSVAGWKAARLIKVASIKQRTSTHE